MTAHPFSASGFFVLRTPSLPLDFQKAWTGGAAGTPDLARPDALRSRLGEALSRPELREAIYLASPDLEATLDPWLRGELAPDRAGRVQRSLIRYLTRMCSRSTPFGLFAGCSLGAWGERSNLWVPALADCRRRTRLDMDYLEDLVASLEREPQIRATLTYRPNTSLHPAAGRWHYAQARSGAGLERSYHLVALEATPHLNAALKFAATGHGLANLGAALARVEGVAEEEAEAFLDELVDAQVLVSGLHPPLTGDDPLPALVRQLAADPRTGSLGEALDGVDRALASLDEAGIGQSPERYRDVARSLEGFSVPVKPKFLFQVDLHKPGHGLVLGPEVRRSLEAAAALLRRLAPARPPGPMERFRQEFRDRYGTRSVPLLEALDGEAGLGFGPVPGPGLDGSPLLEGMAFPGEAAVRTFTTRDAYVMKRLQSLGDATEWSLEERDLAALENPEPGPIPATFSALAMLAAASPEALEDGRFKVLMENCTGPSGAQLLGRFCQGDPELADEVRAFLGKEEALRPGAIFAELVHQPDGRIGNILSRPCLRAFEIPFLGVSGVEPSFQILPQDLRLTLEGDRLVLHSVRLGQEVVPRLTSAHNYGRGLPVYQFLARLQEQDGAPAGWSWGALAGLPFLPRVARGRHVLARARWRIEAEELRLRRAADAPSGPEALRELRRQRRLPRHVVLEDADHTLWVDLDQPPCVETLLHLVAHRSSFTLMEAFPGPEERVVMGPDGGYCHELVVPFEDRAAEVVQPERAPTLGGTEGRVYPPGSEWLYLKIYTGWAGADRILQEAVAPLVESSRGLWDRWFFLRFADPSPHLRLRFQGDPATLTGSLLPQLHRTLAPFLKAGLCWKLQLDTYEREVERYGGALGLSLAETWFQADSEEALALLRACAGDDGAERRWRLALARMDALLTRLGLGLAARTRVVERIRAGLGREFQAEGTLGVQLGARFRTLRRELEARVPEEGRILEPRDAHSLWQQDCLLRFQEAAAQEQLTLPLEDLAASLVHMQVNRLIRASHRAHELVLADCLVRIYRSRQAAADHR